MGTCFGERKRAAKLDEGLDRLPGGSGTLTETSGCTQVVNREGSVLDRVTAHPVQEGESERQGGWDMVWRWSPAGGRCGGPWRPLSPLPGTL